MRSPGPGSPPYLVDTDQQDAGGQPEQAAPHAAPHPAPPLPRLQAVLQDELDPSTLQQAAQPVWEADVLTTRGQVRPLAVLHGVVFAQQVPGHHQRRPRPTGELLGGPLRIDVSLGDI